MRLLTSVFLYRRSGARSQARSYQALLLRATTTTAPCDDHYCSVRRPLLLRAASSSGRCTELYSLALRPLLLQSVTSLCGSLPARRLSPTVAPKCALLLWVAWVDNYGDTSTTYRMNFRLHRLILRVILTESPILSPDS